MQKVIIKTIRVHSPEEKGHIQLFRRGEFLKTNTHTIRNSFRQTAEVKLENGSIITVPIDIIEFVDEYPEKIFIPYE